MSRIPGTFPQNQHAKPIVMKNLLASRTVLFALLAIVAKFIGVSESDIRHLADQVIDLWPVAVAMLADMGAIVARLRQTKFHLPTRAVWLTMLSALISVAGAFGLDLSGLNDIGHRVLAQWPAVIAVVASIGSLWGQFVARKRISIGTVPTSTILPLLMAASVVALQAGDGPPPVDGSNTCVAIRVRQPALVGIARLWSKNDKLWERGRVLRVLFMDGSARQKEKTWSQMQVVDSLVNLVFVKSADANSEIRIRFNRNNGHWSYVGTDSLRIRPGQETMNIGLGSWDETREYRRVVIHETLHAIGFEHEHQHPEADIPWDKPAVYAWYQRTQGWSKRQIDYQVLNRYSGGNWGGTAFDPGSIMEYPIESFMTGGRLTVGWNSELSANDIAELRRRYPQ